MTRLCRLSLLDRAGRRPEALDRDADVVVQPFRRIGRGEVGSANDRVDRLAPGSQATTPS
ncbi:MAG TPA: hypothetical protein VKA58_10740 [Propionibacteriaceae bacterium]|nr:hypothetical protein [Propionibacteriaceae bacterium]